MGITTTGWRGRAVVSVLSLLAVAALGLASLSVARAFQEAAPGSDPADSVAAQAADDTGDAATGVCAQIVTVKPHASVLDTGLFPQPLGTVLPAPDCAFLVEIDEELSYVQVGWETGDMQMLHDSLLAQDWILESFYTADDTIDFDDWGTFVYAEPPIRANYNMIFTVGFIGGQDLGPRAVTAMYSLDITDGAGMSTST